MNPIALLGESRRVGQLRLSASPGHQGIGQITLGWLVRPAITMTLAMHRPPKAPALIR
jgi:hypothetical protein